MAMAKMAGDADSESGCDDKECVQRAASSRREGGGEGRGERSWMKLVPAGPKRADAQREMRRQNGQRDTKFLFSVVVDDFFLSESFCKTAATALIRIAESCLSCIWAGYLVDHHDVSDWGQNRGQAFRWTPPPLNRCNLLRRRGKIGIIIFEALHFRARIA